MKGAVHSIETFGSSDGPGIRFIVFLKGCPMRCQYCHNPDTWKIGSCESEAKELFGKALRYKTYWKQDGGITVSGGEPMMQMEFVTELFALAKAKNIHTCLDTSGILFEDSESFRKLMEVTDLVLLDIKAMDKELHKKLTGKDNTPVLAMGNWLNAHNKPVWIRHVLVPGITDTDEELSSLRDWCSQCGNIEKVQMLPYHTLGEFKWKQLGYSYPLAGIPDATQEDVERAYEIFAKS